MVQKTSIFLFFLIFGISVFLNGSSTGLAYAKPSVPLKQHNGISNGIEQIWRYIVQQPRGKMERQNGPKVSGTVYSDLIISDIYTENINGSINYGPTVYQENNNYYE